MPPEKEDTHGCYRLINDLRTDLDARHEENVKAIKEQKDEVACLREDHTELSGLVREMHTALVGKPLQNRKGLVAKVDDATKQLAEVVKQVKKHEGSVPGQTSKTKKLITNGSMATGGLTVALLAAKALWEWLSKTKA